MFPEDKTFWQIASRELASVFIVAIVLSLLIFALLNGGAFWNNIRYKMLLVTPLASAELREGDILEIESGLADNSLRDTEVTSSDNHPVLVIPKLGITTPIVAPRNESKSAILASLEEGVGLYPGSVNIGSAGRSIILGHSSRASWYRGEYATIFSLLPNLSEGDEILVLKDGERLVYEVVETTVMSPEEANSYVNRSVEGHKITLITCYPIGSASQRNVVTAKLVN